MKRNVAVCRLIALYMGAWVERLTKEIRDLRLESAELRSATKTTTVSVEETEPARGPGGQTAPAVRVVFETTYAYCATVSGKRVPIKVQYGYQVGLLDLPDGPGYAPVGPIAEAGILGLAPGEAERIYRTD